MNRIQRLVLGCFSILTNPLLAQKPSNTAAAENKVHKFWVQFSDKNNSPFSTERPEEFLSSKAIERRKRQHISIIPEDLPVNAGYISGVREKGVKILNATKWMNAVTVETADTSVMAEIRKLPFVTYTKRLGTFSTNPSKKGDVDESSDQLMELFGNFMKKGKSDNSSNYGYGEGYNQVKMLNGVEFHNLGFRGQGMTIAVLDAGFYKVNKMKTFDSLRANRQILGTVDFVTHDGSVYEDDSHGMGVLSCIAANTPNEMIGTAPKASFWLLRTEDAATEFPIEEANWITAAEFADSAGADIINSSLGYTNFDEKTFSYTYKDLNGQTAIISRGAQIASSKGMIIVNAAGNEGDSKWKYIGAPADADNIISVGGVNASKKHASFSSYGPTADGRVKPTVCAQGEWTTVASSANTFYPSNGTSFASPVMCGMVACLWQANPGKTNGEIMDAIIKSSSSYPVPDHTYGYGIPDFMVAHTLLGENINFNYSRDQMVEAPADTATGKLVYHFYSSKPQVVNVEVFDCKNRKKRKSSDSFTVEGKSFSKLPVKNFKKLKNGNYRLVISVIDGQFQNNFVKK